MFDAYEAVDSLIDKINNDYAYEQVYNELLNRVNNGELTLEEAEAVNDKAIEKYLEERDKKEKEEKEKAEKKRKIKKKILSGALLGAAGAYTLKNYKDQKEAEKAYYAELERRMKKKDES